MAGKGRVKKYGNVSIILRIFKKNALSFSFMTSILKITSGKYFNLIFFKNALVSYSIMQNCNVVVQIVLETTLV